MTTGAVSEQVMVLQMDVEAFHQQVDNAATFEERRQLRAQIRELKVQIKGE